MATAYITITGLGNSQLEEQDELCETIKNAIKTKYPDTTPEIEIDDIEYSDEE